MKKLIFTILIIAAIFAVWMGVNYLNPSLDVTSEYSNGKITTDVKAENTENVKSTEFRYRIYYLDQYVNVKPEIVTYSFPNYEENHIYEVREELLLGKKNDIEVEVVITYNDGTEEMMGNTVIKDIKQKLYNDLVIEPEIAEDKVYYHAEGLTAVISKDSYDEEIIFYSDPNIETPNIAVGFHKDYAIYPLNFFGAICETEASEMNFLGMSLVEFTKDQDVDESYIVVEYGMIEFIWDGLYPYDLDGNEVIFENKHSDANFNLFTTDGRQTSEVAKASQEKYTQMRHKVPSITFNISK